MSTVVYNGQKVEAIQVAIHGWIDKQTVVIHTIESYSTFKKKFWHIL